MTITATSTNTTTRFIKRQTVEAMTGLSCSELYRRIADGNFPRQVTLGPKCVVWVESEVVDWCEARIAERRPYSPRVNKGRGTA